MVEQLRFTANELGLPFGPRTKTYNTRLAQELGLWAEDRGQGESYHHEAFRAYFRDGKNLANHGVLLDIIAQLELDSKEAATVLEQRTYRARVDQDWQQSHFRGIRAVPTFIIGQQRLVGAQSYAVLQTMVESEGAPPRAAGGA
jgi:predicted DsbA family dithiol-disulfide isomerase